MKQLKAVDVEYAFWKKQAENSFYSNFILINSQCGFVIENLLAHQR